MLMLDKCVMLVLFSAIFGGCLVGIGDFIRAKSYAWFDWLLVLCGAVTSGIVAVYEIETICNQLVNQ